MFWNSKHKKDADLYRKLWIDECAVSGRLAAALEEIACQETESANATVKRMARIAKEALK